MFILYGLRRTGKTTLIRQLIADMTEDMLMQTAFIQINQAIDLAKINIDLKQLSKQGYRYIFIDEVTLMNDFIDCAALFSDVHASAGIKIVLSGTDSLGFLFSRECELYDRCFMVHTTFIPYAEFENVLGIKGIDEYIRYGGTMSLGGIHYNADGMTFATAQSTDEYVDSAIAQNIQHSLKNYADGERFRSLIELYDAKELTSAINRVVGNMKKRLKDIDAHMRTMIRVIIWKQWKTAQKREWGLLKFGVPKWIAHKVANWGNHYQFVAMKSALKSAVSKEILTKRGLIGIYDYYLKVAHI